MNDAQRMMEEEDANSQVNYIRDMASRLTATEGETAQTVQQIELPVEFIAPASPDMPLLPTASIFTGSFVSGLGYDFLINAALKRINIGGVKLGALQFGGSQEDGAFYAGAGNVRLWEDGIDILVGTDQANYVSWFDSVGVLQGYINTFLTGIDPTIRIGTPGTISLYAPIIDVLGTIQVPSIQLDTTYTPTGTEPTGVVYWDAANHTMTAVLENGVRLQVGQEGHFWGVNKTGATIPNGTPVYISGVQGNRPTIAPCKGDAEATSNCAGVTTQAFLNNAEGYVTYDGMVREMTTLSSFTEGDTVWVSKTTAGAVVNAEPAEPHHSDVVGYVLSNHATQGVLLVKINRHRSLEELSDVDGTTPAAGDVLAFDGSIWSARAELKATSTEVTVNEAGSATVDFRAESDTEANMVFLDASADAVYFGGTTNGVKIGKGGELTLIGAATRFDDLRIEPTARLAGTKTPAFTNWKGGLYLYYFDNAVVASEKELHFQVQLPHAWKEGSTIYPHVHWIPITAGTAGQQVRWGFEYTKAKPGDTFGATTTVYRSVADVGDISVADDHMITDLTAGAGITMTGDTLSTIIICRLFRNSSNVNDNYAGDAGLLYVDIHYEIDSFGSATEYSKEP